MNKKPQDLLNSIFGYDRFRGQQQAIIEHLIAGGDALVLMPTGGGKSICYQIPALIRDGVGIVISPLISLMQDQVDALRQFGVRAAFLNSSLDARTSAEIEQQLLSGELDLVYVAPERLMTPRFINLLTRVKLALFAIDEAHCVSQWGHDFRPEYVQLEMLPQRFPEVPRIALTATADIPTRQEIIERLGLTRAKLFVTGFDRPNINYQVSAKQNAKLQLQTLLNKHRGDAGIIYCLSRKKVDDLAAWLTRQGWDAYPYHAGLDGQTRQRHQERFIREDGVIIVATIAFGMGIDKSNVRFVAHMDMPKSLESYYQETGRAGRDQLPATAWMVYSTGDMIALREMLANSTADKQHKQMEQNRLQRVLAYCQSQSCRRKILLEYFGESFIPPCGNCDNCLSSGESWDGTVVAQKALSTVYRTGQRFGIHHLIDVLLGKQTETVNRFNHHQLTLFGIGNDLSKPEWQSIFQQLIGQRLLSVDDDGGFGLLLTPESRAVLKNERKVEFRVESRPPKRTEKAATKPAAVIPKFDDIATEQLWDQLRACRKALASAQNVPPYAIFHDSTLLELIRFRPQKLAELACISGIGAHKLEHYGKEIIEILNEHADRHGLPDDLPPLPARETAPSPPTQVVGGISETVMTTLELFREGNTIAEICAIRSLKLNTIYSHFAGAIEEGEITLGEILSISDAEIEKIKALFMAQPPGERHYLKPVFESLEGSYDYNILRCVLADLRQQL